MCACVCTVHATDQQSYRPPFITILTQLAFILRWNILWKQVQLNAHRDGPERYKSILYLQFALSLSRPPWQWFSMDALCRCACVVHAKVVAIIITIYEFQTISQRFTFCCCTLSPFNVVEVKCNRHNIVCVNVFWARIRKTTSKNSDAFRFREENEASRV